MTRDEFYAELDKGDLQVVFVKKTDNTTRTMKCTANAPESDKSEHQRATRPETLITVYDIEAKGWRCFYADSIKEVKPLETNFGLLQE